MGKTYLIIAYDGTEIIDDTPESEIRMSALDAFEERYVREERRIRNERVRQKKLVKNPLWRLASFCGIV
ncbi:MAG: hypothetical protein HFI67_12195 [Lachnospiraceae bacterium]|jgi:hypothetical protein|nr:hypothetical protein [Lachnospiraceae bacterium]